MPSREIKQAKHLPRIYDLSLIRRLVKKVKIDKKTGCWVWQGCRHHRDRYGQIKYNGKARQVHRVAYAIFKDDIPDKITVNHNCLNPACCNPEHLTLMTHSENCSKKHEEDIPI